MTINRNNRSRRLAMLYRRRKDRDDPLYLKIRQGLEELLKYASNPAKIIYAELPTQYPSLFFQKSDYGKIGTLAGAQVVCTGLREMVELLKPTSLLAAADTLTAGQLQFEIICRRYFRDQRVNDVTNALSIPYKAYLQYRDQAVDALTRGLLNQLQLVPSLA
jgi:hypothetical protein